MAKFREPTMKDIARHLDVHHSTVSLALRNDSRLPEATRLKVQAAAKELGYRPNPLVSALMTYRSRREAPAYQMELAFLCATEDNESWFRLSESYRRMWTGARSRAADRGYLLNIYGRAPSRYSAKRFAGMLHARNITGLIVGPMTMASTVIDLDWTPFSVVELGFTLAKSNFHRIVHDYFHAMRLALENMRRLGYRRIGLVLRSHVDEKVHHLWRAAYLDDQSALPAARRLVPLIAPEIEVEAMAAWWRKQRPDALLTIEPALVQAVLGKLNIAVPKQLGLASLGCYTASDPIAGIYQAYEEMGAMAVDQLIAQVQRSERGEPVRTASTLIGGVWIDGPTLPPKS